MKARLTEVLWLDTQQQVSLTTLAELSGLSGEELQVLTEYGALQSLDPAAVELHYRAECVATARQAFRLRKDLELDMEGLALVLNLLDRMRSLEAQLTDLRAKLPGAV